MLGKPDSWKSDLQVLENAKHRNDDWRSVARSLRDIQGEALKATPKFVIGQWYDVAAEVTGYSQNILRRLIKAYEFLERHENAFPGLLDPEVCNPPFATVEKLLRLEKGARDELQQLLPKLKAGNLSGADVDALLEYPEHIARNEALLRDDRKRMRMKPLTMGRSPRENIAFIEAAAASLKPMLEGTDEPEASSFHIDRYTFTFAEPAAVSVGRSGLNISWVDAYDIRYITHIGSMSAYNRLVADIALAATFFRHFWLILPAGTNIVDRLRRDLHALGLLSIGLMTFDQDTSEGLKIERQPEGMPDPDRTQVSRSVIMEQGLPGAAMI